MIGTHNFKKVVAIAPASFTNGATASGIIDTAGFDAMTLDLITSPANNATNSPTVLKLQEADVTNATSFTDIPQFVGGGAGGFAIPNEKTVASTAPFASFNVDLRSRKRYIQVVDVPQTTQIVSAIAQLGRAEQTPVGAASQNVAVVVTG
ncbi:hypothetical protein [Capsulimonas corticalis]|nr:hypothetical protein [Capsulimonas corticalis]